MLTHWCIGKKTKLTSAGGQYLRNESIAGFYSFSFSFVFGVVLACESHGFPLTAQDRSTVASTGNDQFVSITE